MCIIMVQARRTEGSCVEMMAVSMFCTNLW